MSEKNGMMESINYPQQLKVSEAESRRLLSEKHPLCFLLRIQTGKVCFQSPQGLLRKH